MQNKIASVKAEQQQRTFSTRAMIKAKSRLAEIPPPNHKRFLTQTAITIPPGGAAG